MPRYASHHSAQALSRRSPREVLDDMIGKIAAQEGTLNLEASLQLTKSAACFNSVVLQRDLSLEGEVERLLAGRCGSFSVLAKRYQPYAEEGIELCPPRHYPAYVLAGEGSLTRGENVFVYFPQCLGLNPEKAADNFGFELLDVSVSIVQQIVMPITSRLLAPAEHYALVAGLYRCLPRTIYLASLFHELGHRVGSFRVIPHRLPELTLSSTYFDVVGELSTDSLAISRLTEFPEVAQYILLQRLFWYPRRGFAQNEHAALANSDNDAFIGLFLWNRLQKAGILRWDRGQLSIDWQELSGFFACLFSEIEGIASAIKGLPADRQDQVVAAWMKDTVQYSSVAGFQLSADQQEAFRACVDIPEAPHFSPLMDMQNKHPLF